MSVKSGTFVALLLTLTPVVFGNSSTSTCSTITEPAPCGQQSDSEERCLSKGCCYDVTKSYPCFYSTGNAVPIDTVHVIQASHFDAGFAYTIRDVLQLWWYDHFPRALALGQALELEQPGNNLAIHFTAQCWLVDLFFNCPPNVPGLPCPSAAQIANVTLSIQKGFLTWHAFPFNSEYELHSVGMMNAGIARCHALDDQFGESLCCYQFIMLRELLLTISFPLPSFFLFLLLLLFLHLFHLLFSSSSSSSLSPLLSYKAFHERLLLLNATFLEPHVLLSQHSWQIM